MAILLHLNFIKSIEWCAYPKRENYMFMKGNGGWRIIKWRYTLYKLVLIPKKPKKFSLDQIFTDVVEPQACIDDVDGRSKRINKNTEVVIPTKTRMCYCLIITPTFQ